MLRADDDDRCLRLPSLNTPAIRRPNDVAANLDCLECSRGYTLVDVVFATVQSEASQYHAGGRHDEIVGKCPAVVCASMPWWHISADGPYRPETNPPRGPPLHHRCSVQRDTCGGRDQWGPRAASRSFHRHNQFAVEATGGTRSRVSRTVRGGPPDASGAVYFAAADSSAPPPSAVPSGIPLDVSYRGGQ